MFIIKKNLFFKVVVIKILEVSFDNDLFIIKINFWNFVFYNRINFIVDGVVDWNFVYIYYK